MANLQWRRKHSAILLEDEGRPTLHTRMHYAVHCLNFDPLSSEAKAQD